jgi:hypothetical protein
MGNHCDFPVSIINPIDWTAREQESNEKPSDLTPEEIAQTLIKNHIFAQKKPDYATAVISKMDAPLRILLQHDNGDDLDLSTSLGKEIEAYFKRLSHDVGIPITLTTRDKKDNNISIIIARNFMHRFSCIAEELAVGRDKIDLDTTQTGTIMGVHELDANIRTFAAMRHNKSNAFGSWKADIYKDVGTGFIYPISYGQYYINNEVKACLIFIETYSGYTDFINDVLSSIDHYINACATPTSNMELMFTIKDFDYKQKLFNALARHQRYFWKLLSHTKTGMSAPEAEQIILKQIQAQQ